MLLNDNSPVDLGQGLKRKNPVAEREGIYPQYNSRRELKVIISLFMLRMTANWMGHQKGDDNASDSELDQGRYKDLLASK